MFWHLSLSCQDCRYDILLLLLLLLLIPFLLLLLLFLLVFLIHLFPFFLLVLLADPEGNAEPEESMAGESVNWAKTAGGEKAEEEMMDEEEEVKEEETEGATDGDRSGNRTDPTEEDVGDQESAMEEELNANEGR